MKDLLLLPGPTEVPERVVRAGSRPMINHRGSAFSQLYENIQQGLRPIFGTNEHVFVLSASGTGALEASVANLFSPGDRILVGVMGSFGKRFADISEAYGLQVDRLEIEWGKQLTAEDVEAKLREAGPNVYRGVLVTHNETSTGVLLDLASVGRVVREYGALLVADAVSGLGGAEILMDEWGVDAVLTASQKALMTPPGLGFIAVSQRAWSAIENSTMPRYYWDLRKFKNFAEKNQTPSTPPVSLMFALEEALNMIHEEGLENVYRRHQLMMRMTRAGLRALGFELLADDAYSSPTVTAVKIPEHLDYGALNTMLRDEFNVILAAGQGHLKGKIFRVGHMGSIHPGDILKFFGTLEHCLTRLGQTNAAGQGVSAASRAWEEEQA